MQTAFVTVLVSLLAMLFPVWSATTGLTDEQAREKAKVALRLELDLPEGRFLNVHRREDFEDDLFFFEHKYKGRPSKGVYFFEISKEGIEITKEGVSFYTVEDAHPLWYVAVSRSTGEAYKLYGFDHALLEFNRMISDIPVSVTEGNAESYAISCLQFTYASQFKTLVFDRLRLKHAMERYFHEYNPEATAWKRSETWWKKFKATGSRLTLAPTVQHSNDTYLVSEKVLTLGENDEPTLEEWKLEIFPDGKCRIAEKSIIFSE